MNASLYAYLADCILYLYLSEVFWNIGKINTVGLNDCFSIIINLHEYDLHKILLQYYSMCIHHLQSLMSKAPL